MRLTFKKIIFADMEVYVTDALWLSIAFFSGLLASDRMVDLQVVHKQRALPMSDLCPKCFAKVYKPLLIN